MKATKVNYFFSGKSKSQTVVLLHGYLENQHIWDDYLVLLDQYNLLIPDLPGFGESSIRNLTSPSYISDTSILLIDLLTELEVETFHLVGNSMGGYVALEIASRIPQAIKSLCLISATPFSDSALKLKQRNRELKFLDLGKRELLLQLFIQQQENEKLQHYFKMSTSVISKATMKCAITGIKNREDHQTMLQNPLFPIGVIYGGNDSVIPINNLKCYLSQQPNIAQLELANTGHMAAFLKPDIIIHSLCNFFTNKILS